MLETRFSKKKPGFGVEEPHLVIREFRIGDEQALRVVYFNAVHQTAVKNYSPEQVNAWAPEDYDAVAWSERIQGIRPFVVEHEGQIVAYADVQTNGYIDHFYVSPTVGRQGVGSLLMRKIHETAASKNMAELFSHVSLTARPFFEKWGFVVEETRTVSVRGVSMNNFRMRKSLNGHA